MEEKKPIDSEESTEVKYVENPYADIDAEKDGEDTEYVEEYVPVNPFEEKTPLTEINYTIHLDEYDKGFHAFQKKYVYPKNWIMTAVFAIIIALYAQQLYMNPADSFRWVLLGLCVAMIAGTWLNTFNIRKKLMKSIKEIKDDSYTARLYDNGVCIEVSAEGEEIPPTYITYQEYRPVVIDRADMFLIIIRKRMFYVIPKENLSEENKKLFAEEFEKKLGKDYIKK